MRTLHRPPMGPTALRLARTARLAVVVLLLGGCSGLPETDRAVDVALAHAGITEEGVTIESSVGQDGVVEVRIVRDIADQDDSVRAVRRIVVVDADGTVVGDHSEQACQPGRGHQDFSTEPCL